MWVSNCFIKTLTREGKGTAPTYVSDLDENNDIHTVLQGVTHFKKAVKAKTKVEERWKRGGRKTNSAAKTC